MKLNVIRNKSNDCM